MSSTTWDVYCPEEDLIVLYGYNSSDAADEAGGEHNADFTPPHHSGAQVHVPTDEDPPGMHLTEAQSEAFRQNESDFAELENHIRSIRKAAETRLRDAHYDLGSNRPCYICTCADFLPSGDDDRKCGRDFCRHKDMQHD
ncbi:hypothetical protein ACFVIY_02850 [Streptomyces sp. NPDC127166]|uniref:hypothetical protein n=1 Tax=Streptomyces sp. NPDC127166 TaxID=3345380 RepID=UPI00363678B9